MGLQKGASYCAIGCHYAIGLPLACLFGLRCGLGVLGLEAGFGVACVVQTAAFAWILKREDW